MKPGQAIATDTIAALLLVATARARALAVDSTDPAGGRKCCWPCGLDGTCCCKGECKACGPNAITAVPASSAGTC